MAAARLHDNDDDARPVDPGAAEGEAVPDAASRAARTEDPPPEPPVEAAPGEQEAG